jgi:hypothetical protein
MAGYSGTPLAKKLGIKAGAKVLLLEAPADYLTVVEPLPDDVEFVEKLASDTDLVHLFVKQKAVLAKALRQCRSLLKPTGIIWISWPKKSAKVPTDITEDTVREVALPLGFVDIKVCAVDQTWSGLKLVIRKELR